MAAAKSAGSARKGAPERVLIRERRWLGVGDFVKVLPNGTTRKTTTTGRCKAIRFDTSGNPVAVDVWGGRPQRRQMTTVDVASVVILSTRMQNMLQRRAVEEGWR